MKNPAEKVQQWLNLERLMKDADPEISEAAMRCQTYLDEWQATRDQLHSMSMQDPNATMSIGLTWAALESLNGYHLAIHQLQFLIWTKKR